MGVHPAVVSSIIRLRTVILVVVALSLATASHAQKQQEFFPFIGQATSDNVNVRAGQSANFERLCQLDKGQEVVVLGHSYGWYRIQLPTQTPVYISNKYVRILSRVEGEVAADHVNIRAGDQTTSTILGQLDEGVRIYITGRSAGWYQIAPPVNAYGWVTDQYIGFKSRDVTTYYHPKVAAVEEPKPVAPAPVVVPVAPKPPPQAQVAVAPAHKEVQAPVQTQASQGRAVSSTASALADFFRFIKPSPPKAPEKPAVKENTFVSVTGYLKPARGSQDPSVGHEIVVGDRTVYFLSAPKAFLGNFANYKVTVEGTLNRELESKFPNPVINVSKIKLLL